MALAIDFCVWHIWFYIYLCAFAAVEPAKLEIKKSGPPYAEGNAVGVGMTIVARISHTPRARPSAQATLYAEGKAISVCHSSGCLAASHVSLYTEGKAIGVCPSSGCLAASHVSLYAEGKAVGVCPSCHLA
jgi:hypothetical protein